MTSYAAARSSCAPAADDEDRLVEGFALARETARRVLGLRLHDAQIAGGLVLARGAIAEMATGEGKTLAAVAPVFLTALAGRGSHVLTFNDYLARRDAAWMGPVYERLASPSAWCRRAWRPTARREAYARDVTYVTAKEAGFDFLRDGLASTRGPGAPLVDRRGRSGAPLHAAIVDEADSS